MTYFQLPNPFMPAPTAPTKESRALVEKLIAAIESKPSRKSSKPKGRKMKL